MTKINKFINNFIYKYLFITPAILLVTGLTLFSILFTVFNSFRSYKLSQLNKIKFIGFDNYLKILTDEIFIETLLRTIGITIAAVSLELIIGLVIAILLSRSFKGHRIIRSLLVLPLAVTPIVNGLTLRIIFDARIGVINYFLELIHIKGPEVWLADPILSLVVVILTDVWKFTPFMIIILLAGILSQPNEIYEAALVDGATLFKLYTKITIPLLRRVLGVVLLIRITDTFRIFDQVYALTGGGPGTSTETLTIHIYKESFRYLNMGKASSMSIIMLIFLIIYVFIMVKRINILKS